MKSLTPLFTAITLALATSSVSASAPEFEGMHKQLDIMNNIIKSSIIDTNNRKSNRLTGITSTYLKGQGVIFTLNSSVRHRDYSFNFVLPELPKLPALPSKENIAAISEQVAEFEVSIDQEEIEELTAAALELVDENYGDIIESVESKREQQHNLRKSQRDLRYRLRDISREVRDIDYQLRLAEKEEKTKLVNKKKSLDKQRIEIEKETAVLRSQSEKLKQIRVKETQVQEKARSDYYAQLALSLADTLCLYGNGLKALPRTENVNVIMKSAGDKNKSGYKDKIYVFSKNDVSRCSNDKITAKQLLANSTGYQF